MDITFTVLKYFKKTAELQHMTKAAKALHVAQSSLSYTMKSLEESLGVPLFERRGRNIILTSYGMEFLKGTNRILAEIEKTKNKLEAMKKKEVESIHIAFLALCDLAPSLVKGIKQMYPQIHLSIDFSPSIDKESVRKIADTSDLALVSGSKPFKAEHAITLFKEELMLAVPQTHPLSTHAVVHLSDFATENFIQIQSEPGLRLVMEHYCREAGFMPKVTMCSDNENLICECIRSGLGVLLVPNVTWGKISGKGIVFIPIASPHCHRYISLVWNQESMRIPEIQKLTSYIQRYIVDFIKKSTWS